MARARTTQAGPRSDARRKLFVAHDRLCVAYHAPIPFFANKDPLSELVSSLLSHRTRNADSARAYRSLRQRFATWEEVRDGDVSEIEAVISAATWPEQKAPRIQHALRSISERAGSLSLDFLASLPASQARDWLEQIPGVGPKTSAAVLLFSELRRRALPVDSHHLRVVVRLGVLPANVSLDAAHRQLEALLPTDWDVQTVYDHHEVLMLHGQRVCHYQAPRCLDCVVLDLCNEGQARVGNGRVKVKAPRESTTQLRLDEIDEAPASSSSS